MVRFMLDRNLVEPATISNNGKSRMIKSNFARKTWFGSLIAGIIILACSSCADTNLEKMEHITDHGKEVTTRIPGEPSDMPDVQYIRTGYGSDINYPVITIVASKKELEQYTETSSAYRCGQSISEFSTEFKNYLDDFFATNFLVIVLLSEGSGSIRHRVESIDEKGNILISRLVPEIGTDDMAAWNIVIELDNKFKISEFGVTFINEKL